MRFSSLIVVLVEVGASSGKMENRLGLGGEKERERWIWVSGKVGKI